MAKIINKHLHLFFLTFLIISTFALSQPKAPAPAKTVVERNRFYSLEKMSARYSIDGVVKGKTLILLLKPTKNIEKILAEGLTITFEGGQHPTICQYHNLTNLCVVTSVPQSLLLNIQCHSLPCQVQWVIYQPQPRNSTSNQPAHNLFFLENTQEHLLGEISCNDPSVTTLENDVKIYSENGFIRAYENNIVYVLFKDFGKGYVYVDVAEKSNNCAFIRFNQAPKTIDGKEQGIKDYVNRQSKAHYQISTVPKQDFSIECSAYRLDKFETLKTVLEVTLLGNKESKTQEIVSQKVKFFAKNRANYFTFIFKAPKADEYSSLELQLSVDDPQLYLLNFNLVIGDVFQVQLGEAIFFHLQQNEKIRLKIQQDSDIEEGTKYYMVQRRDEGLKVSPRSCQAQRGCEIDVQASKETENMLYVSSKDQNATQLSETGKGLFEFQQIQFIPFVHKFKHKIRLGDNIYLSTHLKKGRAYQIHLNSPNIILYASSKTKCQVPSELCRQKTSNYHHPFIYRAEEDTELLINVEGLDNCEFQITVVEEGSRVQLSDGVAFAYTMDQQEERVDFLFKIKEKKDVNFNLVAPLNALKLYVQNTANPSQDLQNLAQSTDGFIQLKGQELQNLQFTVSVLKTKPSEKYFSHFSLIASTDNAKQRLDPTVTNYQTLKPQKSKDFVFEFDRNHNYVLGFSMFNMKKGVKVELKASKDGDFSQVEDAIVIQGEIDFIDVDEISENLCREEGQYSCEIFIRMTNQMSVQIDFSLTLLSREAVIQLKDGIWQSFPSSSLMSTSSFYFYPRHNHSNLLLFYHCPLPHTYLTYKLYRYDLDDINPVQWPFPVAVSEGEQIQKGFKNNHFVSIGKEEMEKRCWPNCVLLVRVHIDQKGEITPYTFYQYQFFKIMAQNSQVELPQNQKISFTLGKRQDKEILIDLKYHLQKAALTFYTSSTIGDCFIRANVISSQQQACPIQNEEVDFFVSWGQYNLQMSEIKSKIKSKEMQEDSNLYLCAAVHSQSSCKMTIEYTSEQDDFKQINMDNFEDIKLQPKDQKLYYVQTYIDVKIKVSRNSGFPYVAVKICQKRQQLKQCKEQFKNDQGHNKQIVAKTQTLTQQQCSGCVLLIKFGANEPASASMHLQGKYSEMELRERETVADFLNEGEENKYMVHIQQKEEAMVNIHVQEGEVEVKFTDGVATNMVKKSTADSRVVQFHIGSTQSKASTESVEDGLLNPLALSQYFNIYHITISSTNPEKAASYTITYSSGKRQFFLQDGLIVDYTLQPKKQHTFYYCNNNAQEHIFYTLTTQSSKFLKDISIKMYTFEAMGEEAQNKKQIDYIKPNAGKKTPRPTLVFDIPQSNCLSVQLTNPTSKQQSVSMGINHQQVVLLPFNHQFPFQLHKTQYLNILADINNPGFIDLHIKKCDQSMPTLRYTFDYQSFIKGQYMFQAELDQITSKYHVKANRVGTLYINVQATEEEGSLLSIMVEYNEEKTRRNMGRPGKHGEVSYEFVDGNTATVSFYAVQCQNCKNVKYSVVSSEYEEELVHHLACPGTFFGVVTAAAVRATAKTQPIKVVASPTKDTPLSFTYKLSHEIDYIAIVGTLQNGEQVFYRPVEVASLWGKWNNQTSWVARVVMFSIVLCVLCLLVIWVRRCSRKGYRPLEELPE